MLSSDHIRKAISTAIACIAQVEDRIDLRVRLQGSNLRIEVTAEQNDDPFRGSLCLIDQCQFVRGQDQSSLRHICAFTRRTANNDQRRIG